MLQKIFDKVQSGYRKRRFAPAVEVHRGDKLEKLGTEYGGWTFEPASDLYDSVVVSCGLGEDASFDVEFAAKYRARVILVDPTPRAIQHFEAFTRRLGKPRGQSYVPGGKQPAEAYDLAALPSGRFHLEPMALWTEETKLRFYAPANPEHVSHSVVNYQNQYSKSTPYLEVSATTLATLVAKYSLTTLPLLKLDIEGAEIQVIRDMLEKSIRPRQILVEFDEMNVPSLRSKKNVEETDARLRAAGYQCRHFDGSADFLYVLD